VELKNRLLQIIGDNKLECTLKSIDLYKREVSICYVNKNGVDLDISQIMVRDGMAIAYRKYSKKYVVDEDYAKANKLGIWDSQFIAPESFRSKKKQNNHQHISRQTSYYSVISHSFT
jgi:endonuclease YncB( thermonuclease family)